MSVCLCDFPALSLAGGSGKQHVSGHSRALLICLWCSLPRTQTCQWRCPITTPPSNGQSSPVLPGIRVSGPPGVFPQSDHAPDQILAAGCEVAAFLLHHHRAQLHLQRKQIRVVLFTYFFCFTNTEMVKLLFCNTMNTTE